MCPCGVCRGTDITVPADAQKLGKITAAAEKTAAAPTRRDGDKDPVSKNNTITYSLS